MEEKSASSSEAVGVSPFGPRTPISINIYNFGSHTLRVARDAPLDVLLQSINQAYSVLERATETVSVRPKIDLLTLISALDEEEISHLDYIKVYPNNFIVSFYFRQGEWDFQTRKVESITFRATGTPLTIETDVETWMMLGNYDQVEYGLNRIKDGKCYPASDIHVLNEMTKNTVHQYSTMMRHATYYPIHENAV